MSYANYPVACTENTQRCGIQILLNEFAHCFSPLLSVSMNLRPELAGGPPATLANHVSKSLAYKSNDQTSTFAVTTLLKRPNYGDLIQMTQLTQRLAKPNLSQRRKKIVGCRQRASENVHTFWRLSQAAKTAPGTVHTAPGAVLSAPRKYAVGQKPVQ